MAKEPQKVDLPNFIFLFFSMALIASLYFLKVQDENENSQLTESSEQHLFQKNLTP